MDVEVFTYKAFSKRKSGSSEAVVLLFFPFQKIAHDAISNNLIKLRVYESNNSALGPEHFYRYLYKWTLLLLVFLNHPDGIQQEPAADNIKMQAFIPLERQ